VVQRRLLLDRRSLGSRGLSAAATARSAEPSYSPAPESWAFGLLTPFGQAPVCLEWPALLLQLLPKAWALTVLASAGALTVLASAGALLLLAATGPRHLLRRQSSAVGQGKPRSASLRLAGRFSLALQQRSQPESLSLSALDQKPVPAGSSKSVGGGLAAVGQRAAVGGSVGAGAQPWAGGVDAGSGS
jgi:hypothetical protein